MATVVESARDTGVSMGAVLDLTVATIRQNPLVMLLLTLLTGVIPNLILTYCVAQLLEINQGFGLGFWAAILFSLAMNFGVSFITLATVTRATVAQAEGRQAELAECLRAGWNVLVSVVAFSALFAAAFMIGFVLLIIPAIMITLVWAVVTPVLVEERRGVVEAIRRSADLTRGARWKIFGLMLLLGVVTLALGWAGVQVVGDVDYASWASLSANPAALALEIVLTTALFAFSAAVQAAIYIALRNWKDGTAAGYLEDIFS